jgi:hypothetical protein
MTFKPMLASECTDTSKLKFSVYVSHKLEGVRAANNDGERQEGNQGIAGVLSHRLPRR